MYWVKRVVAKLAKVFAEGALGALLSGGSIYFAVVYEPGDKEVHCVFPLNLRGGAP